MSNSLEQHRLASHLRERGIRDERVLAAMEAVPRDRFVLSEYQHAAFEDHALPIAAGQTISQPYMVALMTEALALAGTENVPSLLMLWLVVPHPLVTRDMLQLSDVLPLPSAVNTPASR